MPKFSMKATLSKENDKWLDDNSFAGHDLAILGFWGIPFRLAEEKLIEMEARIQELEARNEGLRQSRLEDLRQAYLLGGNDEVNGGHYWCEQGSLERVQEWLEEQE